jgi:hypothetical protein
VGCGVNGGGPITGYGLGSQYRIPAWYGAQDGTLKLSTEGDIRAGGFVVLCKYRYDAAECSARHGAGFGVNAELTAPGEALGSVLAAVAEIARRAPNAQEDVAWDGLVAWVKGGGEMLWTPQGPSTTVPSYLARQVDGLAPLFDTIRRAEWGGMAPGARSCLEGRDILAADLAKAPCLDILVPVLFDDIQAQTWHPDRVRRIVDLRRVAFPGVRIFAFPA